MCKKPLLLDPNAHIVVVYDEHRGTYLESRVTKIATHARCMHTTVTGQRVEKDTLKQIPLKMISCYLQKIRLWDCL